MKKKLHLVIVLSVILVIMGSCSSDSEIATVEIKSEVIENYSYSTTELETMNLINQYRISVGLNALKK